MLLQSTDKLLVRNFTIFVTIKIVERIFYLLFSHLPADRGQSKK